MEHTLAAPGSPVEPLANSQKAFVGCKESTAAVKTLSTQVKQKSELA